MLAFGGSYAPGDIETLSMCNDITCCSGVYNVLCRGRDCHTHTLPGRCHGNPALLGVRVQNHPPGDDQGHQQRKHWKEVQVRLKIA